MSGIKTNSRKVEEKIAKISLKIIKTDQLNQNYGQSQEKLGRILHKQNMINNWHFKDTIHQINREIILNKRIHNQEYSSSTSRPKLF